MFGLRLDEKIVGIIFAISIILVIFGVVSLIPGIPFFTLGCFYWFLVLMFVILYLFPGGKAIKILFSIGILFLYILIFSRLYRDLNVAFVFDSIAYLIFFILLFIFIYYKKQSNSFKDAINFIREIWIYPFFVISSIVGISLVTIFSPNVYDKLMENIDFHLLLGHHLSKILLPLYVSPFPKIFAYFYDLMLFYPIFLSGVLFVKKDHKNLRKLTLAFILAGIFGWVFYFIVPVVGPKFFERFGDKVRFMPIPRNCFPSLHTVWGLLVLIYARRHSRKLFYFFSLFVLPMVVATVYLKYHYLIDLIAAIPFTYLIVKLVDVFWNKYYKSKPLYESFVKIKEVNKNRIYLLVLSVFVISGISALIIETFFVKELSLVFGSTAIAITTILSVYMLGMAIGSYFGGILADKTNGSIVIYAFSEFLIAFSTYSSLYLFKYIQNFYVFLVKNSEISMFLIEVIRGFLILIVVLIPTICMGITFPVLVKHLTNSKEKILNNVSSLYSANIVGASIGVLLATYVFFPYLGLRKTVFLAILLDILAALVGFKLAKEFKIKITGALKDFTHKIEQREKVGIVFKKEYIFILFLAFLLGFVSFSLEVIWTHILAMVVGNSSYAFGVMLFSVLVGLAIGGKMSEKIGSRIRSLGKAVFYILSFLGISILFQIYFWDKLPLIFEFKPLFDTFPKREFLRFLVSFGMLILPTISIGMVFPLLLTLFSDKLKDLGKRVGYVSFVNTGGDIAGSIIAGFVLIPYFGSYNSLKLIVVIIVVMSLISFFLFVKKKKLVVFIEILAFFFVLIYLPKWDMTEISLGTNVYFYRQHSGKVIDWWEEKDGGFTTVTKEKVIGKEKLTLWTNGKFQGDNLFEMTAQRRFAMYPIVFTKNRDRALVIGLGTGVSSGVVYEAGFKSIDIAEISPGIVEAAKKYFSDVNDGILGKKNVHLHITDGRNFLLLNKKPYDLITMEISSIWFSGAASLYSKEFYEIAKANIKENGVFQQWIQLHHITKYDVLCILATVRSVFKHVRLFLGNNQGVIVASKRPLNVKWIDFEKDIDNLSIYKKYSPFHSAYCLLSEELLDEDGLNKFLVVYEREFGVKPEDVISTDDNMFLEYSTPRGNVRPYGTSLRENISMLEQFRKKKNTILTNYPSKNWKQFGNITYMILRRSRKDTIKRLRDLKKCAKDGVLLNKISRLLDILVFLSK